MATVAFRGWKGSLSPWQAKGQGYSGGSVPDLHGVPY